VITPVELFTLATAGVRLAHVAVFPVIVVPAASFGTAVPCAVPFTLICAAFDVTVTEATGPGPDGPPPPPLPHAV